jgi:putative spermidine/putrescine transport system permease protein
MIQARKSAGYLRLLGRGAVVAWFLMPFVPLVVRSLAGRWNYPSILPQNWSAAGPRQAVQAGLAGALVRSVWLSLATMVIATAVGSAAALGLHGRTGRATTAVYWIMLAPILVPPYVLAMGLSLPLLHFGVPGVVGMVTILVAGALPYTTFLMRSALSNYNDSFDDQARVLGADQAAVLTRVRLPILRSAVATAAFLAFLVGWSDYIVTLLIGGGQFATGPILIASTAAGSGNESVTAAMSLAYLVPPSVLFLFLRRRRRSGAVLSRGEYRLPTVTAVAR